MNGGQRGFSLIELLISLTLLAMIMTLLVAGLRMASVSWERSYQRLERAQEQRLVEQFIIRELSQAHPLRIREDGKVRLAFEGEPKAVRFAGVLPPHRGVGGTHVIWLTAERGDNGEQLVLSYRLARPNSLTNDSHDTQERTMLLDGLANVEFEYYGSAEDEQGASWQRHWQQRQRLPQMIRLRFSRAPRGPSDLIIPLHLTTPYLSQNQIALATTER